MAYQLVVTKGRSTTQALRVPADGVTTVGRQQGCQIRISSSQVSRKHCELFERKGLLLVKDLNSSNGTFVNGKRIEGQQVLEAGNTLTIGGVSFRVEALDAAVPAAAAAAARPPGPGDTAVPKSPEVGGDADIELDFEIAADDEDDATILSTPPRPAAAAEPEPDTGTDDFIVPEGDHSVPEIGEDAVADYLLNIDLDDEDKA